MDTTQDITHVSLCAGYGGIDLGLKRAIPSLRTIAFSEIEAFACANLVAKMEAGFLDPAPIWTNVKTFPFRKFRGKVGILSAGYPCQPFSAAGNRLGTEDPRHLWPFIADGIAAMRPEWCFFENVEGHISLGLSNVIEDLAEMGYRTTWGIFSAAEVGAPHQRKRVFILAYRNGKRGLLPDQRRVAAEQMSVCNGETWRNVWPSRPSQPQHGWEPPRVVGNAESGKDNGRKPRDLGETPSGGRCGNYAADGTGEGVGNAQCEGLDGCARPRLPRERRASCISSGSNTQNECIGQAQPPLGGDLDGASRWMGYAELCVASDNRTDELRLLGNGVVPATAERAFTTLLPRLLTYA